MIQVKIKNKITQEVTHGARFQSQELAQAWISEITAMNPCPWGKPERVIPESEATEEEKKNILETIPAQGEEGTPGYVPRMVRLPSEYEVVTEDITAQVEAEEKAIKDKEDKVKSNKEYLNTVDMTKINSVTELKAVVTKLMEIVNLRG